MKQLQRIVVWAVLSSVFIPSGLLFSDEPLVIIKAGNWKPYHYTDEGGNHSGFLIDLLNEASRRSGVRIEIRNIPNWSRCLYMMKRGDADAFMPLFKTPERETFMTFYEEGVLAFEEDCFFKVSGKQVSYDGDFRNMKPYAIGVIKGYSYGSSFDAATYLNTLPAANETALIRLLLSGKRYDLIIGDRKVIQNLAEELGVTDKISVITPPVLKEPLYIGFSKIDIDSRTVVKFVEAVESIRKTEGDSFRVLEAEKGDKVVKKSP